jgi:hypothetical protein
MTAILRRQAHLDKNGVRAAVTVVEEVEAAIAVALHGRKRPSRSRRQRAGPGPGADAPNGRRTPQAVARHASRLLAYIKANPGKRAEEIAAATGLRTQLLSLPLKKLVADKKVKTSGVARGTTYSVV